MSLGLRDLDDVHSVQEFWEARRGRLRGFRFKDWSDFKSTAPTQTVAPGDQTMQQLDVLEYQLVKVYSAASNPWTRTITKPVAGTVRVADDTGELSEGTDWTLDYATGVVTLAATPTGVPTAGFEFDVPVRFQDEDLEINVALFDVGSVPAINLIEVRS